MKGEKGQGRGLEGGGVLGYNDDGVGGWPVLSSLYWSIPYP